MLDVLLFITYMFKYTDFRLHRLHRKVPSWAPNKPTSVNERVRRVNIVRLLAHVVLDVLESKAKSRGGAERRCQKSLPHARVILRRNREKTSPAQQDPGCVYSKHEQVDVTHVFRFLFLGGWSIFA